MAKVMTTHIKTCSSSSQATDSCGQTGRKNRNSLDLYKESAYTTTVNRGGEVDIEQVLSDPIFPQIAFVLSPEYMRRFLQTNWIPENNSEIISCTVGEKRHKPGKDFQISYRLHLLDPSTQVDWEQVVTARLYANMPEIYCTCNGDVKAGRLRAISYLPELKMLVRAFPFDGQLINLPSLHDIDFLLDYFNSHPLISSLGATEQITEIEYKVMHYLPEKSCMTRYKLNISDPEVIKRKRTVWVYGKNYHNDGGQKIYHIMLELAAQNTYCAEALAYDDELKTLWQSHVPGVPLEWRAEWIHEPNLISNLAACIAAFHNSQVHLAGYYGFAEIFKQLTSCCKLATRLDATLFNGVTELQQQLMSTHHRIDWSECKLTPLHLDLKMGNLLVDHERVFLIDMDSVCMGDPLVDIGSFIANLYLNGLRAGAATTEIDDFVDRFLQHYRELIQWQFDPIKLDWYIAAALVHEILRRSIRQHDAARMELTTDIINISAWYLQRAAGNINA